MKKTLLATALGIFFLSALGAVAAVQTSYVPTLLPIASLHEIGTSSKPFLRGNFVELCLTGDSCKTAWPTGGSGTNYFTNSGANTYLNTGTNLQAPTFEATSTTASSTLPRLIVSTAINLFGTFADELSDLCVAITGGAGLCDGTDNTGGAPAWGSITGTISDQTDLWGVLDPKLSSTTLALFDKGFFFSTTSALYHLGTLDKGYFFSTSSAAYHFDTRLSATGTLPNLYNLAGLAVFGSSTGSTYTLGKFGIGTTSPYAALSVVGNSGVVAEKYNATGTATSTFTGGISANNFSAGNGSITNTSYAVGSTPNTGLYLNGANILGFAGNGSGMSWSGSALYPNTSNIRTLGIASTNIWDSLFVNSASTTNIYASNKVGIGTTSPYAALSVAGDTVTGTLTATTSTSTFAGLRIATFGLRVDGLNASNCDLKATTSGDLYCGTDATGVGGGAYAWTPSTNYGEAVSATTSALWVQNDIYGSSSLKVAGSVTADSFTATNTLATSTFAGAVQIGGTSGDNALRIAAAKSYPASDSVGGMVRLTNTLNAGSALGIYSNFGAGATNDLMIIQSDNVAYARRAFRVKQDGTGGAGLFDCLTTSGVNECLNITSTDLDTTTLGVSGATDDHGVIKVTAVDGDGILGNASNAAASLISGVLTDASQGIFLTANSGVGSSTGKFLQFRNFDNQYVYDLHHDGRIGIWEPDGVADAMIDITATSTYDYLNFGGGNILSVLQGGNVGIGTSSPYAKLSVAGQVVAQNYVATSTASMSLFPNINGVLYPTYYSGADIGAKVMTTYNSISAPVVYIHISATSTTGTTTYAFSTAMNFNIFNRHVNLSCDPGVVLNYTGSATSTILNTGSGSMGATTNANQGIFGCNFIRSSATRAGVGIEVGGSNGFSHGHIENNIIDGFATGLYSGSHAYLYTVEGNHLTSNIRNVHIASADDSGEQLRFIDNDISDCYDNTPAPKPFQCFYAATDAMVNGTFVGNSFDDANVYISEGSSVTFTSNYWENPNQSATGKYVYLSAAPAGFGYSNVNLIGGSMTSGATAANQPYQYITCGTVLKIDGVRFQSFDSNPSTVAVGEEGDCRLTVDSIINVADAAFTTFSTTTDVGVFQDARNLRTGIGTSTPSVQFSMDGVAGAFFRIFNAAKTKVMEIRDAYVDFTNALIQQHVYRSFSYATSTAWTGTTTIYLEGTWVQETWNGIQCRTDTGTLNVTTKNGSSLMNTRAASSTLAKFSLTSNNAVATSTGVDVDVGTPASSPTKINCTYDITVNK